MLREQLVRCLRDPRFDRIDLVVSFIMTSGIDLIAGALSDALARGARVRILTTDYLGVTDPDALTGLLDLMDVPEHDLDVRIFHDELTSFHPKSYIFRSADGSAATAFVGSSNLSASGISGGIEWNLGVEEIGALVSAFEGLWSDGRTFPLTHDWLRAYREKPGSRPSASSPSRPSSPPSLGLSSTRPSTPSRRPGRRAIARASSSWPPDSA